MASAPPQPDLPVDLLEEIFLRVDDAADLVRASAACVSFHHLVFDGRFLRRFRSLNRRPILGFLNHYHRDRGFSFYPAEPPCRSTPAARALAGAADFSFSFLPNLHPIRRHARDVCDIRDGRVLLSQRRPTCRFFEYLVVYDPMHHHRVQIPPIPNDLLVASAGFVHWDEKPFLVPAADEDDLSFQVMFNMVLKDSEHNVRTFVYSSVTGKWRDGASFSNASYEPARWFSLRRHYAHGCFYWVDCLQSYNMLMFNVHEMKFSIVDLPPGTEHRHKAIVQALEDKVGLLILGENTLDLYSKARQDIGIGAKDWRHDHMIPLLDDYKWSLPRGVAKGYALLRGLPRDEYEVWSSCPEKEPPNAHYFTVELETLLVEQLCVTKFNVHPAFLYASFPPPFAPPSI